jgi:hypothetical protein
MECDHHIFHARRTFQHQQIFNRLNYPLNVRKIKIIYLNDKKHNYPFQVLGILLSWEGSHSNLKHVGELSLRINKYLNVIFVKLCFGLKTLGRRQFAETQHRQFFETCQEKLIRGKSTSLNIF